MSDMTYYVVINDNPLPHIRGPSLTGPSDALDFHRDKDEALERRDLVREQYNNPDVNVYRMTVHEGMIDESEEDGCND